MKTQGSQKNNKSSAKKKKKEVVVNSTYPIELAVSVK